MVLDLDDDNYGYSEKEESEAGTNALDANDQPFLKMGKLLIKIAIDKAAENAANQVTNSP